MTRQTKHHVASSVLLRLGLSLAAALPVSLAGAGTQPPALDQQIAALRLESWQHLIDNGRTLTEPEQLEQVNRFINRSLSYASDQSTWQTQDYWATPVEALSRGRGDCEDYALAKFFGLTQMGIPSERLRLTYVKDLRHNQAHMVLTYQPPGSAEPLVLDSLQDSIQPASQRRDLLPVYAFNDQGIYLASAPNRKARQDSGQIALWSKVRERALSDGSLDQPPRS